MLPANLQGSTSIFLYMAGIQLSGLASGFDWKSTVTQLMSIERVPQDNLRRQQAAALKLQTAYNTLKTNLTAVKTAASALGTSFTGTPRSVSVAAGNASTSASDASATTSSGAALGTYTVNVTGLPKASSLTGASKLFPSEGAAKALTLADYGVTEGTVTVNGVQYTLSSSDLSKTIGDIFPGASGDLKLPTAGVLGAVSGVPTSFGVNGAVELTGAAIQMGGAGDTSNFVSALGLNFTSSGYTQTIPQGTLAKVTLGNLGTAMSGSDTLTINGVSVGSISASSTLGAVVSQINSTSGTGVTATIDPSTGKLRLTANSNGDYPISVTDGSGGTGVAQILGLTTGASPLVRGSGTKFKIAVDGGLESPEYTSPTAEIDLSRYGYGSTKVTPTAIGVFSVRVTSNASDNKGKITALISAYNSLKQMVDDSTKVTTGTDGTVSASVFSNRSDINSLLSNIRSRVYSEVKGTGISPQYNTIGKIGIGFDKNGTMSVVDSAKLDAALAASPSAVNALLNNGTASGTVLANQGVATRLVNLMTSLTGTGGLVAAATASITTQTKRLQTQINALDRSLAQQQASLEASFIAMERAQSKFNNMSSQIASAFTSSK
jgi:flagellar hook-associated protein 2